MIWIFLSIALATTKLPPPPELPRNASLSLPPAQEPSLTERPYNKNQPRMDKPLHLLFHSSGDRQFLPPLALNYANSVSNATWSNLTLSSNETVGPLPLVTVVTIASYIILIVVTIAGNCLVIAAFFKEPALQAITNYWIVSLSLTDIILASTVMPLQIKRETYNDKWVFGQIACDVFICLDVLCCTCSIYHLGLISLDRYFCVRFPIRYPCNRTTKKTVFAIFLTWCWCMVISMPRLLGWKDEPPPDSYQECKMTNKSYMLFSSLISFYIPLFLSACMYIGIYRATKARTRKFRRELAASMRVRDHIMQSQQLLGSTTRTFGGNTTPSMGSSFLRTPHSHDDTLTLSCPNTSQTPLSLIQNEVTANITTGANGTGSDESTVTGCLDPDHLEVLEESEVIETLSPNSETQHNVFHYLRSHLRAALPTSFRRSHTTVSLPPRVTQHRSKSHSANPTPPPQEEVQAHPSRRESANPGPRKVCLTLTSSDTNITTHRSQRHSLASHETPTPPNHSRWRARINFRGSDVQRRKKTIAAAKLTRRRQKQEVRAARVVVIVFGAFVAFWMPFFLVNTIEPLCGCQITRDVWKWVTFWGYVNSAVNPFIYTFFNRTFRRAIFSVIRCERKRH